MGEIEAARVRIKCQYHTRDNPSTETKFDLKI